MRIDLKKMDFKLVCSLISLVIINSVSSQDERAYDYHVGTWNMQGSGGGAAGSNKWSTIRGMLVVNYNQGQIYALALQESGSPPTDPVNTESRGRRMYNTIGVQGYPDIVEEYVWTTGTSTRPGLRYYIYHCEVGVPTARNSLRRQMTGTTYRTNLAIVSQERADEVILFRATGEVRPVLCIQIRNMYFCSIHANSRGGARNGAPRAIGLMENYFRDEMLNRGVQLSWMILGDFNQTPQQILTDIGMLELPNENNRRVLYQGIPTQQSGRVLDFAWLGQRVWIFHCKLASKLSHVFNPITRAFDFIQPHQHQPNDD